MNTMALGGKLDKKGGFCLIRGPGMLFSFSLGTNSWDEVHGTIHTSCFFHIIMFIFLLKSKILSFRATGVQCNNKKT